MTREFIVSDVIQTNHYETEYGFPVSAFRFDQKDEMFKRSRWDGTMQVHGERFYEDIKYRDTFGYRKIDYSFRNASWNLEWGFGFGVSRSNSGLYSWDEMPSKWHKYLETGDMVRGSPEEMNRNTKRVARFFGASLVGVAKVHPNWIYSHEFNTLTHEHYPIEIPEACDKAVVIAIEMDYNAIRSSPNGVAGAATGLGYSKMAFVANAVAAFIRGLGYRAIPCGNDTALSIPLAMAAGLGECSRMGLLVTEKFGPRVRLCKVFTDAPLLCDSYRPFGVVEFCRECRICAINCPSQAITHNEMTEEGPNLSNHSGVRKWYVNAERCFAFWAKNRMDCTDCIRVCPFNKPSGFLHDLVRAVIKRTPLFNRTFVWMDKLLGYDKRISAAKFWASD
jgi:epoxyqueuosine reductase